MQSECLIVQQEQIQEKIRFQQMKPRSVLRSTVTIDHESSVDKLLQFTNDVDACSGDQVTLLIHTVRLVDQQ